MLHCAAADFFAVRYAYIAVTSLKLLSSFSGALRPFTHLQNAYRRLVSTAEITSESAKVLTTLACIWFKSAHFHLQHSVELPSNFPHDSTESIFDLNSHKAGLERRSLICFLEDGLGSAPGVAGSPTCSTGSGGSISLDLDLTVMMVVKAGFCGGNWYPL